MTNITYLTKERLFFKTLLTNTIIAIFAINMAVVLHFLMTGHISYFLWLLTIPFFGFMITRFFAKQFMIFVLIHLGIVAVVAFAIFIIGMRMDAYVVPTRVFIIFSLILSFRLRSINEWMPDRTIFGLLFFAYLILFVLVLLLFAEHRDILELQLVHSFLISCGILLVYIQMDELDYRLNLLRSIDDYKYPATKVILMNNLLIMVFSIIVVIFASMTMLLRPGQLILPSGRNPQQFMENMAETTWEGFEEQFQSPTPTVEDEVINQEEITPLSDETIDSLIRINSILSIIAVVFVAVVLVRIIYKVYLRILSNKVKDSDTPIDEDITITSLSNTFFTDLLNMLPTFKGANIHPMRKRYIKKINAHIRGGVVICNTDTVEVIADKIRNIENIDSLTASYEQVRYGR